MAEKFIFTWDNRWLKKYYDDWKKKEAFGTYILIGASGSGKSLFVKELVKELAEEQGLTYCMYTGQEIESLLLKQVREQVHLQVHAAPVMIFEDVDSLLKCDAMKKLFEEFICQYQVDTSGKKRLILLSAIDFTAFQLNGYAIPVNPLSVSLRVVRRKAREYQMKLSARELWKLSRCKRVSEVEAELRKMKMKKGL